jgi:hypothetical protein
MLLHGATIPGSLASSFSETAICKSRGAGKVAVWKSLSTSNTVRRGVVGVRAAQTNEVDSRALTGVIFEPFREVQSQLVQVPTAYSESLARQRYDSSCEAAINEQIKYAVPPPPSLIRASCPEYIHLFLYTERLKSGQREENSVILVGSHGVIIFYSVFVNVLAVWSTMCHMYHVLFILFY